MKKMAILLTVLAVFSFLFCNIVMAFPPLPDDLNIVQPDPSLPKELAAFSGKWEGKSRSSSREFFLIVEKIDQEKATLYIYGFYGGGGWDRIAANVVKEYGKWKIWFSGRYGRNVLSLRGKYLDLDVTPVGSVILERVI